MKSILKIVIVTLAIAFVILETEARINRRWVHPDDISEERLEDEDVDASRDEEASEISRRAVDPKAKPKYEFPKFPGDEDYYSEYETNTEYGPVVTEPIDNSIDTGNEPLGGGTEQPRETESKPWYKKVKKFFKKHYENAKDKWNKLTAARDRRDDYFFGDRK